MLDNCSHAMPEQLSYLRLLPRSTRSDNWMRHSCVGKLVCLISSVTRMWFTPSPLVVEERRVPVACLETNTWEVTLVPGHAS